MPLSKKRKAEYQKRLYWERKRASNPYLVARIARRADIRAMKRAGIDPEYMENEAGKISAFVYYTLLRDRDAIKAHLSWHHEAAKYPDIGTVLERQQAQIEVLQARVTQLEADMVVHESQAIYQTGG